MDDNWSFDILDLKVHEPEIKRGYRYVLVVIDNLSNFGRSIPLKNRNAQTLTNPLENILSKHSYIFKRKTQFI